MNCQQSEQLIPLFVEADLDNSEMQAVTKHIELCNSCRVLVYEFQASQSSFRNLALPAFDEAVMTRMRSAVQQEIAPTISRPSIVDSWWSHWNWKFAFAVSAVILLVSGIVLLRRDEDEPRIPIAKKTTAYEISAPSSATEQKTLRAYQPRTGRKNIAQRGVSASERNAGKIATNSSSPARAADITNQIAATAIAPSGAGNDAISTPRVDTLGFILPPAPQSGNQTISSENSAPETEMIRMEFQTADPNIKIIWLTPKEPTRPNPVADTK